MTTPRMRTAEGALAVIKTEDPETAVTLRAIRGLINTGKVPQYMGITLGASSIFAAWAAWNASMVKKPPIGKSARSSG